MNKLLIGALLLLGAVIAPCSASAQTPKTEKDTKYDPANYSMEPIWIDMMRDPQANYYETIKAFREFWTDRILPEEPFEKTGAGRFEIEVGLKKINASLEDEAKERAEKARKLKLITPETIRYSSEVKAFKGWLRSSKPWVKKDGSIYTMAERQAIINKQREELKETEKQNKK